LDEETQQLAEIAHTEITRVSPVPIGLVPAHSRCGRDKPNFWYLKMDPSWRSPKNWRLLTDLADAA
jgi:hypothetical protein